MLEVAAKDKPDKFAKAVFANALADFSQNGYDVKTALDGKAPPQSNGWATHPKTGEDRTALFELKTDITNKSGSVLKFTLNQQYQDGTHSLGKFRISITTSPRPINFGPPGNISKLLAIEPAKRNVARKAAWPKNYRGFTPPLKKAAAALAEAKKPLPADEGLKQRQDRLAKANQPLPIDPELVELQRIADMSKQQLEQRRLTIAQDLTWALMNSPAFFFNH